MTYIVCNGVSNDVSHRVRNDGRTTVQNQNQNQTLFRDVCGVFGYPSIDRQGRNASRRHGWMD